MDSVFLGSMAKCEGIGRLHGSQDVFLEGWNVRTASRQMFLRISDFNVCCREHMVQKLAGRTCSVTVGRMGMHVLRFRCIPDLFEDICRFEKKI